MFAIDIVGISNKMIPNVTIGALCECKHAAQSVNRVHRQCYTAKHTVVHMKHFNASTIRARIEGDVGGIHLVDKKHPLC